MNARAPKVSACVITYNHRPYIERALLSALTQETSFEVEVIVADDCSTDGTADIVESVKERFPDLRVLRHEANVGPTRNFLALHDAARGEFVAHMDGDDFWGPGKLEAQVRFLERHLEAVAGGHRMAIVRADGRPTGRTFPRRAPVTVTAAQVTRWGMPFLNSSMMYRRAARTVMDYADEVFDWFFLTDLMRNGDVAFLDETLGSYTLNPTSITGDFKRTKMLERMLDLYRRRIADRPDLRADVFCWAAAEAFDGMTIRQAPTKAHRTLLAETFSLEALPRMIDTYRWRFENGRAFQP